MKKKLVIVVVCLVVIVGVVVAVMVKNLQDERHRQELMTNAHGGADAWAAYQRSAQESLDAKAALETMRELVAKVDARRDAGYSSGASANSAMSAILNAVEKDELLPWSEINEKLAILVSNVGLQMEIYQKDANDADLEKLKLLIAEEESACDNLVALASK